MVRVTLSMAAAILALTTCWAAELYIVWDKEAPLFVDTRRAGSARQGEVVEGAPREARADWLEVRHEGTVYTTPRVHYLTAREVDLQLRHLQIDAEGRQKALASEIQVQLAAVRWREAAGILLYRDETLYQRTEIHERDEAKDRLIVRYGFDPLISSRSASRLKRQWEDESAALSKALEKLRAEARTEQERYLERRSQLRQAQRRLEAFARRPDSYRDEVHMVTAANTRLYQDQQGKGFLRQGDTVVGHPNERYPDWLVIQHEGASHVIRRADLIGEEQWRLTTERRQAELHAAFAVLDQELETVRQQEALIQQCLGDLAYRAATGDEYAPVRRVTGDIAGGSLQRREEFYFLRISDARRAARDLEEIALTKSRQRQELLRQETDLRKNLATLDSEAEAMLRRLEGAWREFIEANPPARNK